VERLLRSPKPISLRLLFVALCRRQQALTGRHFHALNVRVLDPHELPMAIHVSQCVLPFPEVQHRRQRAPEHHGSTRTIGTLLRT